MTDDPSRRRFLQLAGLAATALATPSLSWAAADVAKATLRLRSGSTGRTVSPQLVGLSFETLQLHDPNYFSAHNHALVGLLRRLNPHGVLRIGGNSSDYSVWSQYKGPLPSFAQLPHAVFKRPYVITPEQLESLAGFLDATGWKLVFGVNVHRGAPAMAAELATAVQRAVGDRLQSIQIGNEPNMYRRPDGHAYRLDDYLREWAAGAAAIRARADVPVAGPDTGANTDWVLGFADKAPGIVGLSRHYYRGGAPEPTTTIEQMLAGDPEFFGEVAQIVRAADTRKLPFVISEVNSYWGGGKLGVSNTLASALWGGDYALACAQAGVAGINVHGGTLSVLEASLDKNVPAAPVGADRTTRLDAISGRYTPIAGDAEQGYYARPLYYGLLLAQQFAGARFIDCALQTGGANLTAYAAERDGRRLIALFNKDLQRDVSLKLDLGGSTKKASAWRLAAPAIDDVHATTFGGRAIGAEGAWSPVDEAVAVHDGGATLRVARGSAVLVSMS